MPKPFGLSDNFDECPELDEESERRGRARIQKRLSIGVLKDRQLIEGSDSVAISSTVSANSGYTQSQLAEHYASCLKLSAENKINIKNAFNLQLIDYMVEMMDKKMSGMENFLAASCALDASAKIYGYRVDSLLSNTLKLAGGVGKTSNEPGQDMHQEDPDQLACGDEHQDDEAERKRTKRRRPAGCAIEKNLNNINLAKFDLELEYDLLFKKNSAQMDSVVMNGQFLCNLKTRDDEGVLLLASNALPWCDGAAETTWTESPSCSNLPEDVLPDVEDECAICPSFSSFKFTDWCPEKNLDVSFSILKESEYTDEDDDKHAFDVHAAPIGTSVSVDHVNGHSEDSFEGMGFFDQDNVDDRPEAHAPDPVKGSLDLIRLRKHLSSVPTEYSYFDQGRLGSWGGPDHWKLKSTNRFQVPKLTTDAAELTKPGKQKASQKKSIVPHDLVQVFADESLALDKLFKQMLIPRLPPQLQKKTMLGWSGAKNTLPPDLHYKGKDFAQLFHLDYSVMPKKNSEATLVDDSVTGYNFANRNDADNFCPAVTSGQLDYETGFTGADYPDDDDDDANGDLGTQLVSNCDQSLVAAPNKVQQVQIGYAKMAKKMNMRKLKMIELELVKSKLRLDQAESNDKENVRDNKVTRTSTSSKEDKEESHISFCWLYKTLGAGSTMPPKMKENLSVSLAFIGLLHLCNEHNLSLEQMPEFNDFLIKSPTCV